LHSLWLSSVRKYNFGLYWRRLTGKSVLGFLAARQRSVACRLRVFGAWVLVGFDRADRAGILSVGGVP
jgi:hypothetical protein